MEGADLSWDEEINAENLMFDDESICISEMSEIRRFEEMMNNDGSVSGGYSVISIFRHD